MENAINKLARFTLALAGAAVAAHASAQVTVYEGDAYQGRSYTTTSQVARLDRSALNNFAASVVVKGERTARWEVCEDRRFRGRCVVLRPGAYPSLADMGLNKRISSIREIPTNVRIADSRYAPLPNVAGPAFDGSIVFYRDEGYTGRSFMAETPVANFRDSDFNDQASSAVVRGGPWQVCENNGFQGRCTTLPPGEYPDLGAMGLGDRISSTRAVGRNSGPNDGRWPVTAALPARAGQVDFYENEGFQGRSFSTLNAVDDLRRGGFQDRASSVVVTGERWEVCDDAGHRGRCVLLRPGQYPSLQSMDLNSRVSSVRQLDADVRIDERRYAPAPLVSRDYRRRDRETLYQAEVLSVRAVVDDGGRRCWVEREAVQQERSSANVPGALLGAVIGGILGHQVGGGSGRDVATGIGVVAGAAIGGNAGRSNGAETTTQDVQRCSEATRAALPTYYDVSYRFRGQDFKAQLATPPAATITVNADGEPRA